MGIKKKEVTIIPTFKLESQDGAHSSPLTAVLKLEDALPFALPA